jgi:tetratricopeptide (TPR) repeat protein
VDQKDLAGEAGTLGQLGLLYEKKNKLEEAAVFYRQAADKYLKTGDLANEDRARSNLAGLLIQLKRFPEARQELQGALEFKKSYGHAAKPWKTWAVLCALETADGNTQAAAEARSQAAELFLAYRRDGGENHEGGGRLCADVLAAIKAQETEKMEKPLTKLAGDPGTPPYMQPLIFALLAILSGSRDPAMADDPGLSYADAAEVRLVLERI